MTGAKSSPIEESPVFQQGAKTTDILVSAVLARAQAEGIDPRAIASGALYAIIRYHVDWLNVPRTERSVLSVMIPAIGSTARKILNLREEPTTEGKVN